MKTINDAIKSFENVPFGNSSFQITHFLENLTPERQYRNCLLQISQKINALKKTEFEHKRKIIELKKLKKEIKNLSSEDDKELKQVDIDEKEYDINFSNKLINDAIIEIDVYLKQLSELPDFTREQFENAEIGYWKKRLTIDAENQYKATGRIEAGTIDALCKVGLFIVHSPKGGTHIIDHDKLKKIQNKKNEVIK